MFGKHDDQGQTVSPFDGLPTTTDIIENGVPTITVEATDTEPFRMKVAVGFVCAGLAAIFALVGTMDQRTAEQALFQGLMWSAIACLLVAASLFARQPVTIRFTPTHLAVRRGYFAEQWHLFDLAHPHSIGMALHDKAMQEKLDTEYSKEKAARGGTAVQPELVYGDTYHICFSYFGQRHDLLTVRGRKEAARITSRLQACLEINRARAGKGGSATRPGQQWTRSSGGVPR